MGIPYACVRGEMNVNHGEWHHVAGVHNGARVSLYIDGVTDVSINFPREIGTNNWNVFIGANEQTKTMAQHQSYRSFDGLIDDLQIYDYALTGSEIKKLYDESKSVPDKN